MKRNNNWVTTGAAFLLMGATLSNIYGCSSSENSGIVSQPSGNNRPSPEAIKSDRPTASPAAIPTITASTSSNQQNSSQQNTPVNPSANGTSKQPASVNSTNSPAIPKIRVNPDNALSPQLVVERGGKTYTFNAQDLRAEVMGSINCQKMERVDRQNLTVTNFMRDQVSVNPQTGDIAIGVILQYCALTQESAVVLLQPKADGSYQSAMLQVPGKQALPSNTATYPLGYIKGVRYTNGNLMVSHGNAAGAEAELVFRSGEFASCRVTGAGEGTGNLCP